MISYRIVPMHPDALSLCYDSWLNGLRAAPASKRMPAKAYFPWARGNIDRILGQGALLLSAQDQIHGNNVHGWICCQRVGEKFLLHALYVKREARASGIARDLLTTALESLGGESLAFTHDMVPSHREKLESLGFSRVALETVLRTAEGRAA